MSTHNIGFYEDLTKIIFELSSNIIKFYMHLISSAEVLSKGWEEQIQVQFACAKFTRVYNLHTCKCTPGMYFCTCECKYTQE